MSSVALALIVTLSVTLRAFAATPTTVPGGPLHAAEVEAYFDRLMRDAMQEWRAPGGVAVVVRDGNVLLCKGYGQSDVEAQRPFDPERSRFPVGSVSKYITTISVMQLVEAGKVRLDAPIDNYISKHRPINAYSTPITLADCLTYSAGLEGNYLGFAAVSPAGPTTLDEYLDDTRLVVRHEPGTVNGYCNEGHALAGYVLEQVSRQPFDAYARAHVFEPAGMSHSGYRVDGGSDDAIAIYGHEGDGGLGVGVGETAGKFWRHDQPFYARAIPSAGLYSSGADLANLMRMLLEDGKIESRQVLSGKSVGQLFQTYLRGRPRNPEIDLELCKTPRNGQDCVQQGGAWPGFTCKLVLLPKLRTGFFIGLMHYDQRFSEGILEPILNHYYPIERVRASFQAGEDPAAVVARHQPLAGEYLPAARVRSNFTKLEGVFRPTVVSCQPDGSIRVDDRRYVDVGNGTFQRIDDDGKLRDDRAVFSLNREGTPLRLYLGIEAYDRAPLIESAAFNRFATRGFLAGFVLLGIAGPLSLVIPMIVARLRRVEEPVRVDDLLSEAPEIAPLAAVVHPVEFTQPRFRPGVRALPWLALAAGILNAGFLVTFRMALKNTSLLEFLYGTPSSVSAALKVPPVSAFLAVVMLVFVVRAWRTSGVGWLFRTQYTLTCLLAVAFIPYLAYWHLLPWPPFMS